MVHSLRPARRRVCRVLAALLISMPALTVRAQSQSPAPSADQQPPPPTPAPPPPIDGRDNPVRGTPGTPSGFFFEPSAVFTQVYDDNLFLTADDQESDFFSRLTPGVTSGFRNERVLFIGTYNFDAERYQTHQELQAFQARQNATVDLNALASQRVSILINGTAIDTTTPSELNLISGVIAQRAQARRFSTRPQIIYRASPNTTISTDYTAAFDQLAGGADGFMQSARVELKRQPTQRLSVTADYAVRDFQFDGVRIAQPSQVTTFGLGYAITPFTSLTVRGGPRFAAPYVSRFVRLPPGAADEEGDIPIGVAAPEPVVREVERSVRPEWSVAFHHEGRRGAADATFVRTESTAIGQEGVVDAMAAGLDLLYRPAEPVELRAAPSVFRDTLDTVETRVYRLATSVTIWVTRHLAIVSEYRYGYQQGFGVISPGTPTPTVRQNMVSIGLLATARHRPAPPEPRTGAGPQERR